MSFSKRESKVEEQKIENVPEKIGSENLKKIMEDLQVNDPAIYAEKTQEQAKKQGSKEYVKWLLHLSSKETLTGELSTVTGYLKESHGIDLTTYNPNNLFIILSYICGQLRQKARTTLYEKGKKGVIIKYSTTF